MTPSSCSMRFDVLGVPGAAESARPRASPRRSPQAFARRWASSTCSRVLARPAPGTPAGGSSAGVDVQLEVDSARPPPSVLVDRRGVVRGRAPAISSPVLDVEAVAVEAEAVRIVEVGRPSRCTAGRRGGRGPGRRGSGRRWWRASGRFRSDRHLRPARRSPVSWIPDAVALHLEVVTVLEHARRTPRRAARRSASWPAPMARHTMEERQPEVAIRPSLVVAQQIHVDARLVVEALEVALRHQLDQVLGTRSRLVASSSMMIDGVEAAALPAPGSPSRNASPMRCRPHSR